ncbi:uncharacterized protein BO97DRAFT_267840 [Aspergillus homomorphus CBS 101889]|uniref:Uncharacterized protein n=1 Tax=Aspergillus homomorphus (strain CBS 101889) TaxID=1450537 RepID=A0A395HHE5_ASPHC|nr:hypothetical protein BO97DRAFT_267840 [Aspergillus homomorphus CBS 101889]RAL07056.1 hypothetical protein BO97DRAFT_267840 [Aspergillus homomorphus CBS 101889]
MPWTLGTFDSLLSGLVAVGIVQTGTLNRRAPSPGRSCRDGLLTSRESAIECAPMLILAEILCFQSLEVCARIYSLVYRRNSAHYAPAFLGMRLLSFSEACIGYFAGYGFRDFKIYSQGTS